MAFAAAFPMFLRSPRRVQRTSSASRTLAIVGAAARIPETPFSITSEFPPTSVAITGRPHNMASTIASGSPSHLDGIVRTWLEAQISSTIDACPANTTRSFNWNRSTSRASPVLEGPSPYRVKRQRRAAHDGCANASSRTSCPFVAGSNLATQARRSSLFTSIGGQGGAASYTTLNGLRNDLRILNFTSEMGLGDPLIRERNEITAKSCRQYLSISGGEFIARPPQLTVVLPNRYEGPFLGNEHFSNVDWGQSTPIRSYDKSRSNRS